MEKINIAVLFGGVSPEHGVSLQSAASVLRNLDPQRYNILALGITRAGMWLRYSGSVDHIESGEWETDTAYLTPAMPSPDPANHGVLLRTREGWTRARVDIAFPVLHGKNGEDGTVQGLLSLCGIPCVGCGVLSSALCMDKNRAHILAQQAGVRVPRGLVLNAGAALEARRKEIAALGLPLFVKPVRAGSSFGITRVTDAGVLCQAVSSALEYDDEVIVEEAVAGFEVGCAVMGNGELFFGVLDEIELRGGFFDFNEKYTLETAAIHLPARIDEQTAQSVRAQAAAVYRALNCRGFARVDFFITPEGGVVFNEVNTIPGFTAHSRYPGMMRAAGLDYPRLLDRLVELGLDR